MLIEIENLKCGGCGNTIKKELTKIEGVEHVTVEVEHGRVNVEAAEQKRSEVVAKLLQLGYPEVGSTAGIEAGVAKVKSYVSCAIGKLT
jgi:copper chaperone